MTKEASFDPDFYPALIHSLAQNQPLQLPESDFAGEKNLELFRLALAGRVENLLRNDYSSLLNLLYRIDVAEEEIGKCLSADNLSKAALSLADAIIRRQIKKLKYRQSHPPSKP